MNRIISRIRGRLYTLKCKFLGKRIHIGKGLSLPGKLKIVGTGTVYIGDNCHIGSCCTIDRGKIDLTYIGNNCMIDNQVHIAHNVILSDNACIAAQTGIAGSVKIGTNVTVGGQVGFAGHITIGNNVVIAAKSGVTKNINDNSFIAGFPATDIKKWKKKIIKERRDGY